MIDLTIPQGKTIDKSLIVAKLEKWLSSNEDRMDQLLLNLKEEIEQLTAEYKTRSKELS